MLTQKELKEEMRQDMLNEQAEQREQSKLEYKLSEDYEYFMKYYNDIFETTYDNLRRLKDLYKMYNHEFDINEINENI